MGSGIKAIISQGLKALEQGMFQELCLSFLPLYNQKYQGLRRHGGTAEGKTRKGTPDLIKTNSDSTQIAVECSVDKEYWKKTANLADTKPSMDINECVVEVKDLVEIVLCSSQEIPTNNPNAHNEIIAYAQTKTSADITLVSLPILENELFDNFDKYQNVIRVYLPEAYQYFMPTGELLNKSDAILEAYKRLPQSLDKIIDIANELKPEDLRDRSILDIVLEKGSRLVSRFQRRDLPNNQAIKREYSIEFFGGDFIGRAISVLGFPKIGKTSLVSQVCREYKNNGIEILWFESPSGEDEQSEFLADVSRTVLGRLVGQQVANEFIERKLSIYELNEVMSSRAPSHKCLVVIDDISELRIGTIEGIDNLIQLIKSTPMISSAGFILISNRTLDCIVSSVDGEYPSPKWDENELRQFLEINNISIPKPEEAYCGLLRIVSGGHPLIALALAQKCRVLTDLLDAQKEGFPELHHEELTKEVKQLLFKELLTDNDLLQFVLRLSVLIYRHDVSVLEFLSSDVVPQLSLPTKLILEKLKGSVIEGDESIGYQVAFLFKSIASSYVTESQKKLIWGKLSNHLLIQHDKTIDGLKTIEGVHYALLIPDYGKAFSYALQLIMYMYLKESDENVIRFVLLRFKIVEMLNFPLDDKQKLSYVFLLMVMAQTYNKIRDYDEANILLHRILDNKIENQDEIDGISLRNLYDFVGVFLILNLSRALDYDEVLNVVNKVDPKIVFSEELPDGIEVLEVIHYSILKSHTKNFPRKFFASLLEIIEINIHKKQFAYIIACFQRIAFQISRQNSRDRDIVLLNLQQYSETTMWKLLVNVVDAQVYLELEDYNRCIQEVDILISQSNEIIAQSNVLGARLLAMKADSFYGEGDRESAEENYKRSIDLLEEDPDSDLFNYSWCNYRLGLISSDIHIVFDAFSKAAFYYEKQEFKGLVARSYGELAVIYYQKGNLTKSIEVIESLVETYYYKSVAEYAPAVTIGLALLVRLTHECERRSLPGSEAEFPLFERGIFDKVKDFAKPNPVLPQALLLISEAYKSIGEKENQKRVLLKSLENKPRSKDEFNAKFLSLVRLMKILADDRDVDGIKQKIVEFINEISQSSEDDLINKTISPIFAHMDSLVKNGSLDIRSYNSLIIGIEDEVVKGNDKKKGYILAEIYQRKAGINGVTLKEEYDKSLIKKAWEYAHANKNYGVQLITGYYVGFEFIKDSITSIKELANVHLSVLEACCLYNREAFKRDEEIKKTGINLYNAWPTIKYRTAKESEYLYIINLKYRAENLINNNVSEDLCYPVMILCLIKVFNMTDKDDYKIAIEWAKSQISDRKNELPLEEREYLKELLE